MIDSDFVNEMIGKPWVNRGESFNGADCWGVVILSFREIDSVELPQLKGYQNKKCKTSDAAKEAEQTGLFKRAQATNGAIMTVHDNHGNITHVGRCLCGRVLHSTESMGARWDTYASINSQFKNVRYYKYAVN